jgi:predicted RNA methylase
MRDGQANANAAFDHLLPAELRKVSGDYWTPLPVIRRVASWLRAERVDTVVDIGSGAGKFCVVTALMTPCRVIGLEQRPSLVASAQALAALCELEDRVTFVTGAFGDVPTPKGSAYYLFNPFGEYAFSAARDADDDVVFSEQAYTRDVDAMTRFLARAPFGTVVITYNGFGADLPPSYEQIRADLTFRAALRLWKKRRPPTNARTSFRRFTPVIHMPDP